MLSISYGWLHEGHPDPEMFYLKRLAKVVKAFKKFHSLDCEDCAVFLDFCSLWQKELVDGVGTRTPEQIVQFKEALDEINTPYEAITSVRLEAVPEGTVRTYHMRGWTEFEKRIINCKGFSDVGLRTTVVLPEGFDADCSDQDMVRHFDNFRRQTDFEGPPLKPSRFNEKLRQLHEGRARQWRPLVHQWPGGHGPREAQVRRFVCLVDASHRSFLHVGALVFR